MIVLSFVLSLEIGAPFWLLSKVEPVLVFEANCRGRHEGFMPRGAARDHDGAAVARGSKRTLSLK